MGLDVKCFTWVHVSENLSPSGGTVWECYGAPLGGGALLEEVHHWGWDLRVYGLVLLPVLFLGSLLVGTTQLLCFLISRPVSCSCNLAFPTMMDMSPQKP